MCNRAGHRGFGMRLWIPSTSTSTSNAFSDSLQLICYMTVWQRNCFFLWLNKVLSLNAYCNGQICNGHTAAHSYTVFQKHPLLFEYIREKSYDFNSFWHRISRRNFTSENYKVAHFNYMHYFGKCKKWFSTECVFIF